MEKGKTHALSCVVFLSPRLGFSLLSLSAAEQKHSNQRARARTFLASFFSSECEGSEARSRSIAAHVLASRFDASSWQALLALACSGVRSGSSKPKWSTTTRSFVGGITNGSGHNSGSSGKRSQQRGAPLTTFNAPPSSRIFALHFTLSLQIAKKKFFLHLPLFVEASSEYVASYSRDDDCDVVVASDGSSRASRLHRH